MCTIEFILELFRSRNNLGREISCWNVGIAPKMCMDLLAEAPEGILPLASKIRTWYFFRKLSTEVRLKAINTLDRMSVNQNLTTE